MSQKEQSTTGPTVDAIVYVVDDDPLIRASLTRMMNARGLRVEAFASANEFLACEMTAPDGCLILDVNMPDKSGIDLQRELLERDFDLPVIFLTGHGDVPLAVQAMQAGAVNMFTKPADPDQLLEVVWKSIESHSRERQANAEVYEFKLRVNSLSPREREVLILAVQGLLNKQIASRLSITERTVKEHRSRVTKKTGIHSIAELARLCERAGILDS